MRIARTPILRRIGPALVVPILIACGPATVRRPEPSPSPGPRAPAPAGRAVSLRVDHAWVKDAADPATQAARRVDLDRLRRAVEGGASFTTAWEALRVDGGPWHVAEGETYVADVLPAGARDLAVGQVSPVLPGDGGLHLFRILAREPAR